MNRRFKEDSSFVSNKFSTIRFSDGNGDDAVALMFRYCGFLVAPSGTCFGRLCDDEPYRRAMQRADLAIPDSGLMVLLWRLQRREKILRVSGLNYLRQLLAKLKGEGRRSRPCDCEFRHGVLI
jgi:hypothetical protein